jgi:hypothetical protein
MKTDWKKEFDKKYEHWVEGYVCASDAFDMDLRHSVAKDELKLVVSSLFSEIIKEVEEMNKDSEKLIDGAIIPVSIADEEICKHEVAGFNLAIKRFLTLLEKYVS